MRSIRRLAKIEVFLQSFYETGHGGKATAIESFDLGIPQLCRKIKSDGQLAYKYSIMSSMLFTISRQTLRKDVHRLVLCPLCCHGHVNVKPDKLLYRFAFGRVGRGSKETFPPSNQRMIYNLVWFMNDLYALVLISNVFLVLLAGFVIIVAGDTIFPGRLPEPDVFPGRPKTSALMSENIRLLKEARYNP